MKHLLFAMCLAASMTGSAQQPAATATVEGTWRSDADSHWSRSDNERWVNVQMRHGDNATVSGFPSGRSGLADRRPTPVTSR